MNSCTETCLCIVSAIWLRNWTLKKMQATLSLPGFEPAIVMMTLKHAMIGYGRCFIHEYERERDRKQCESRRLLSDGYPRRAGGQRRACERLNVEQIQILYSEKNCSSLISVSPRAWVAWELWRFLYCFCHSINDRSLQWCLDKIISSTKWNHPTDKWKLDKLDNKK